MERGQLLFEWDGAKNTANLRKHGFDFADASEMFSGVLFRLADLRTDYGEERWTGIGMIQGRVAVIVFTQPSPDTIRVISLRKALKGERVAYEKAVENELGKD